MRENALCCDLFLSYIKNLECSKKYIWHYRSALFCPLPIFYYLCHRIKSKYGVKV